MEENPGLFNIPSLVRVKVEVKGISSTSLGQLIQLRVELGQSVSQFFILGFRSLLFFGAGPSTHHKTRYHRRIGRRRLITYIACGPSRLNIYSGNCGQARGKACLESNMFY
jgi:hypothetical protein